MTRHGSKPSSALDPPLLVALRLFGRRRSFGVPSLVSLVAVTVIAVSGSCVAHAAAQSPAPRWSNMTERDYLTFNDRMQSTMDASWNEREGLYQAGDGSQPMVNSNMLLAHAVAAMRGHDGPSRDDDRARRIAWRLVQSPPFVETPLAPPSPTSQEHVPGWINSVSNPLGSQHLVFDADVVDGLVHAWRAREQLRLPQETVDLIVNRVVRTAHGSFWRYPTIRLNQINWYALMYAASAEMTGDPRLLQKDFRRQLLRFTRSKPSPDRAGNFGPGMRFHYLPDRPAERRLNVDSAEYANIVYSFSRFYEQAEAGGMRPIPDRDRRLLAEWGMRLMAGYWTHAGYLNWDTGLGFNRWHQTKKLGLSQQALIGLATTEALQTDSSRGVWAKWMFDRGLELYDGWSLRAGGMPAPVSFDVDRKPLGASSARLATARMVANAARAIAAGMGSMPSQEPPALYAFDPDIGRLAVTTPAYNTAVIAVSQGAFPYGGVELARLYDGDQDVAANIGGRVPAAFGMVVRSRAGRRLGATQVARKRLHPKRTPLELVEAPRAPGRSSAGRAATAFAGPFRDLRARGTVTTARHVLRTDHRFTPWWIETTWKVRARSRNVARQRYSAEVHFPSTGPDARAYAVLADGRRVAVGDGPIPLALIAYLDVRSRHSGYVIVPRERPAGAQVTATAVTPQWSAPAAGPTTVITLSRPRRFKSQTMGVRMVPVTNAAAAAQVARQLGAR